MQRKRGSLVDHPDGASLLCANLELLRKLLDDKLKVARERVSSLRRFRFPGFRFCALVRPVWLVSLWIVEVQRWVAEDSTNFQLRDVAAGVQLTSLSSIQETRDQRIDVDNPSLRERVHAF